MVVVIVVADNIFWIFRLVPQVAHLAEGGLVALDQLLQGGEGLPGGGGQVGVRWGSGGQVIRWLGD